MNNQSWVTLALFSFTYGSCFLTAVENPSLDINLDARPIAAGAQLPVVSYANVLQRATPSVVSVYTASIIEPAQILIFKQNMIRKNSKLLVRNIIPLLSVLLLVLLFSACKKNR